MSQHPGRAFGLVPKATIPLATIPLAAFSLATIPLAASPPAPSPLASLATLPGEGDEMGARCRSVCPQTDNPFTRDGKAPAEPLTGTAKLLLSRSPPRRKGPHRAPTPSPGEVSVTPLPRDRHFGILSLRVHRFDFDSSNVKTHHCKGNRRRIPGGTNEPGCRIEMYTSAKRVTRRLAFPRLPVATRPYLPPWTTTLTNCPPTKWVHHTASSSLENSLENCPAKICKPKTTSLKSSVRR